ncbi:MAG: hypothetical protein ABSG74_02525 [Candidatus Bathyarchaeia archaeon]|jgi:hypothetical protein
MIEGVVLRRLKPIPDERGWLVELMRSDWDVFDKNEFVGFWTRRLLLLLSLHFRRPFERDRPSHSSLENSS